MKKWFILLYLILTLSLSGCFPVPAEIEAAAKEILPKSKITKESCYLCGPDKKVDFIKRPHDTIMILWSECNYRVSENPVISTFFTVVNMRYLSKNLHYGQTSNPMHKL